MGLQTLEDSKPKGAVHPAFIPPGLCLATHRTQRGSDSEIENYDMALAERAGGGMCLRAGAWLLHGSEN